VTAKPMTIDMSGRGDEALELILAKLRIGLFPYYDGAGAFCWDCRDTRTVIWLNEAAVAKADKMLKKIPMSFRIEENRAFDEVLEGLSSDRYKKDSWVRGEVMDVYRILQAHGYMSSVEARTDDGLAGAVLGIDLRQCFIIETMLSISSKGSKAALCHAVKKFALLGYPFVDVQRPHPPDRPCARLFEHTMPIDSYRELLTRTLIRSAG
jgi:leucyl/phenylalanyl-tRNA--protein transferase